MVMGYGEGCGLAWGTWRAAGVAMLCAVAGCGSSGGSDAAQGGSSSTSAGTTASGGASMAGSGSSSGGSLSSDAGSRDCGDRCGAGQTQVTAGDTHTCALTSSGQIRCWGRNALGQLGNGSTTNSLTPTDVLGLPTANLAVSAGYEHACALTSAGGVACWGNIGQSELGPVGNVNSTMPVDVIGLASGVIAISAGAGHTCALTSAGGLKCWGGNGGGALGNNTRDSSAKPVDVIGLSSGVVAVSTGITHSCALVSGGGVKCWGGNVDGELGNKGYTDSLSPVDVVGLSSGVRWLSAGAKHTCAVTATGGVQCWGSNHEGQLGNDSKEPTIVPVDVSGLSSGVVAVAAGGRHSCALTETGAVKCWGYNVYGELGRSVSSSLVPVDVDGLSSGVVSLAAGSDHTCAVTSVGAVKCWGRNDFGAVGDGTTGDVFTPRDVKGFEPRAAAR